MLDGVTINQLRTFVAVCDEESFSGAAKKLRRAQSAISHAISSLEASLEVQLFERDSRRAKLSAAGRSLLPDARAVIARTEEMKTRARSVVEVGAPQLSLAVDVYFPRQHLITALRTIQRGTPAATINVRVTTMQAGEALVLDGVCSFAITPEKVPELRPSALERHWLCERPFVTVCAPTHPLALDSGRVTLEEFNRHIQLVVTDNQPDAEKSQIAVAGERRWYVNDLSAKLDFLVAGLGWGHMPADLVAEEIAQGELVELKRHAWHVGSQTFMLSRRRGHLPSPFEAKLIDLIADACASDVLKDLS